MLHYTLPFTNCYIDIMYIRHTYTSSVIQCETFIIFVSRNSHRAYVLIFDRLKLRMFSSVIEQWGFQMKFVH